MVRPLMIIEPVYNVLSTIMTQPDIFPTIGNFVYTVRQLMTFYMPFNDIISHENRYNLHGMPVNVFVCCLMKILTILGLVLCQYESVLNHFYVLYHGDI